MCQINVLVNPKPKDCVGFLQTITTRSYEYNSDGEGFYCDNGNLLVKGEKKIDLTQYSDNLNKSKFILIHERLTTSGKGGKYSHPFQDSEFIFAMNGVVSGKVKEPHSDTYMLFEELKENWEGLKHEKIGREKKIVKLIKSVFNELEGSFSIVLFDKRQEKLYYFKNSRPSIYWYSMGDSLFITTNTSNEDYSYLLGEENERIDIKDCEIYCVSVSKNQVFYKVVGEIKEKAYVYYSKEKKGKKSKKDNTKGLEQLFEKESDKFEFDYPIDSFGNTLLCECRTTLTECAFCKSKTYNFFPEIKKRVCEECVDEGLLYEEFWDLMETVKPTKRLHEMNEQEFERYYYGM